MATVFDSSLNDEVTRVLDMCNNTLSGLPNPSTEVTNTLNEINTLKQRLAELKVKPSPVTRRPSLTDMIFKRFANTDTPSTSIVKEEKEDVRKRSEQLLTLLKSEREYKHRSIAIVTHKGYLREFERGPLGRPDARSLATAR